MSVLSGFPIVVTRDLLALEEFYVRAFAAERTFAFTAPDGSVAYVSLTLGGAELGIAADPDADVGAGNVEVWLYVDDVDAHFARAVEAGAEAVGEPADMPWGERVAHVRDPTGVLVNLGSPAAR